jgi:hypothetical protein
MQSKTSVKVIKAPALRPENSEPEYIITLYGINNNDNTAFQTVEISDYSLLDKIIKYCEVLNISQVTEKTISYKGQNKEVEKAVRKWIKTYCEFGKVRYNPKNDQTHIIFKTGR